MPTVPLNIVADAHIWQVRHAFSRIPGHACHLQVLESSEISPMVVRDADVLLTRSATKVNRSLLEGSRIRFVGTATIGDDHIDKRYLAEQEIAFASAAGSSTGSVLEYMVSALLTLQSLHLLDFAQSRIGVIGAGRIGGRVGRICTLLGMPVAVNDPPRARREGTDAFMALDTLLEYADVLTLHTPLIREGEDCTAHLLNAARLQRFRGRGVINAARGECVDNGALADWLDEDASRWAVLDCWEHEPEISRRLLAHPQVVLATPHIAGHSLDGKAANTQFVYDALCRFLGVSPGWRMEDDLPGLPDGEVAVAQAGDAVARLAKVVRGLYPVDRDSRELKGAQVGDDADLAAQFVRLRRHYRVRRGWGNYALHTLFGADVPENFERLWRVVEAMDEQ